MVPSFMASQIYENQNLIVKFSSPIRTCFAAVCNITALSMLLKASAVFTFLILPSARIWPAGILHIINNVPQKLLTTHLLTLDL